MSTDTPEAKEPETKTEAKKPRRSPARPSRSKKSADAGKSPEATVTVETLPPPVVTPKSAITAEVPEATAAVVAKDAPKPPRKPAVRRPPKAKVTDTEQTQVAAKPVAEALTEVVPAIVAPPKLSAVPEMPVPDVPVVEGTGVKTEVKKKRRRSRNKKSTVKVQGQETAGAVIEPTEVPNTVALNELPVASSPDNQEGASATKSADEPVKKSGRKRKRGPRKKSTLTAPPTLQAATEDEIEPVNADEADETETTDEPESKPLSIKLLINADEPEECRVALLENGKLESFHVETMSREQHKGNIYKGRIVSIETNLQAAFVDLGTGKNGFLPFSEIHPEYYSKAVSPDSHWKNHKMKEVLAEGQEVLVEVVKDVTGNKGASLTTFLSLPGRYVVLMPGSDSHGISKKIDKESERQKLREMLDACNIPEGVGYIIRTASDGITKAALTNDVRFQIKLWQDIKEKAQREPTPALLYKEQSIIDRFLRDHFSAEIEEILVDSQEAYDQVDNFLALLPAIQRKKTTAKLHKGPRPLLNSYNIEEQIDQIFRPTVKLPSGGSIVINPTEALVSIDVNSGSTGRDKNFEDTIFLANMEAAEELARQLRLRDLGGLIVVDFIDMRPMSHIREVEKKVKTSMKRDKAKVDFTRISKFGLMEISRQRMGAPIQTGNHQTCEYCEGHGIVRSVETQALAFLRQIQTGVTRKNVSTVHCRLPMEVGQYLLNKKRADLAEMEKNYKVSIVIETDATLKPAQAKIDFIKEQR
jgi:ribonuclease E